MSLEEAKSVIESALDKAMQRGVYTLKDSAIILQALTVLFDTQNKKEE